MTASIVVDAVTKTYLVRGDRPATLKEAVLRGFSGWRTARRTRALDGVSLEIAPGRTVGIIGPNGAGKSTLLRLIGGVGRPDSGRIEVTGHIAALLEIGAVFHPDLTGREVAVLGGVVAGMMRAEVRALVDEIAQFAGLTEVIDQPMRTYSTGMQARLGFSIAAHTRPDVLLVDEVLAVGDAAFQRRCVARLREFQRRGVTIVIVSHDHHLVADLCHEVVWLRGGRVAAVGPPDAVVARYLHGVDTEGGAPVRGEPAPTPVDTRFGSFEGRITAVRVVDRFGVPVRDLAPGAAFWVEVDVELPPGEGEPVLAASVVRDDWLSVLDTSTTFGDRGERHARLHVERFDAAPGSYALSLSLFAPGWGTTWDFHDRSYPLRVVGDPTRAVLLPPLAWEQESAILATNWE
ncbi:MAG TPA: ABC transporter ATP-binding protein [Acidimicrobiales bacterium]|nr:ABC transporter ATP-binding protein [Acidimicrobiales bacterium]